MGKIALVAGNAGQLTVMHVFSQFAGQHEVRLHAFQGSVPDSMRMAGFALNLYEADPQRAGYMAGLEEQLVGVDLIIVAGAENLSSFQALRSALKHNIPCHCISFDLVPQPFDDYSNIRAIRHDVLSRSQVIWATGERSVEALLFEGFELGRIEILPMQLDPAIFCVDGRRGQKFRNHVGITQDAFVILFQDELDHKGVAGELVKALHALRTTGIAGFERIVVLFSGNREGTDALKYMISDWRLASHVRFLHQNTSEFFLDLLNASDIAMGPSVSGSSEPYLLAAMASLTGALPLLSTAQVSGGWSPIPCANASEYAGLAMAKALRQAISDNKSRNEIRDNFITSIGGHSALDQQNFHDAVEMAITKSGERCGAADFAGALEEQVIALETRGKEATIEATLQSVEDLLLRAPPGALATRVNLCKGAVLYTAGKYEEATEAYRAALLCMHGVPNSETSQEPRGLISNCYRGLGNVAAAVLSHQEALDLYRRALALDPQDSLTCMGIGNVYRRLRLYEQSLHWLAKSAISMPEDESALTRFSQALLECPEKPIAARALMEVVQVVGEHPLLAKAMDSLDVNCSS